MMVKIIHGQCGLCAHFGEDHGSDSSLIQIRVNGEAPEEYHDSCGHPKLADLHLKVSAASGCDGFIAANAA